MTAEENKATFRRYVEEVPNQGNLELADEIFGRYVAHQADSSTLERGPEDVKRLLRSIAQPSPTGASASTSRSQKGTRWSTA